jgi:peptide-methionine (S)-S-oxide reductase
LCLQGRNANILNFARSATMGCELQSNTAPEGLQYATFAGGCFWGLELKFQRVPGVQETSAGYAQGHVESPTYEAVCGGRTGHTEAVRVTYNPDECQFESLLEAFAEQTDLTTKDRQGSGARHPSVYKYHHKSGSRSCSSLGPHSDGYVSCLGSSVD